jgi:hypothetical protein
MYQTRTPPTIRIRIQCCWPRVAGGPKPPIALSKPPNFFKKKRDFLRQKKIGRLFKSKLKLALKKTPEKKNKKSIYTFRPHNKNI